MEVFMKYGYFDDINREYVITDPATPLPWINYLGCRDFFSLISNTCGGYSFYKDAKLLRLTRYRYNNVPADSNGRYFYLKEGNSIWNPRLAADPDLWIFMNAGMEWDTAALPGRKTI